MDTTQREPRGQSGNTVLLATALDAVAAVSAQVAGFDADVLARLAGEIRGVRGALDRLSLHVTRRADELHRQGASPGPDDLWSGTGADGGSGSDDGGDGARDGSGSDGGRAGAGVDPAEGRRQRRRLDTCRRLPAVGAGFERGTISASHVDLLGRILHGLDRQLRAAFEALHGELADHATELDVGAYELWCRARLTTLSDDLGRQRHERQLRDTRLRTWTDPDGTVHLHGRFHPELGQRLTTALQHESDHLRTLGPDHAPADLCGPVIDQWRQRDHLAAHALARLVLTAHRTTRPGVAEICVVTDARTLLEGWHDDSLCEHHDGTPLPVATLQRLTCIAELRRVLMTPEGLPLDVGRTTRLANRAQRRALRALYPTCAWPGCTTRFDWCEIHHLHPWEDDGPTDIDNLLPLCVRHHHHAHELGWTLTLHPDRTLTIHRPDRTHHSTTPPPSHRPRTRQRGRSRPPGQAPPGSPPPGQAPPGQARPRASTT